MLAALKDGAQAVRGLAGADHGVVSLAIVGTLAGTTIVEQLRSFPAQHLNARLELRTAISFEFSDLVRRAEVSLGLRYFADPSLSLSSFPNKSRKRDSWLFVQVTINGAARDCGIPKNFAPISGLLCQ